MKTNLFKLAYLCSIPVLFSLQDAYSMEVNMPQGQEIVIISNDNQKIIVPVEIIPLMTTIQDLRAMSSGGFIPITLFAADSLESVIKCVSEVKRRLKTRNELLSAINKPLLSEDLGKGYIPWQVNSVIRDLLGDLPLSDLIKIIEAAAFLGASFIANSCVPLWVEKQVEDYSQCADANVGLFFKDRPILLEDIIAKAKLAGLSEDSIDLYVIKHWNISNAKASKELSVADLIALNEASEVRVDSAVLDFSGKNITSLVGINQIKGIDVIKELYLDNNKLIAIEATIFKGLSNLKVIILTNNPIVSNMTNDFVALMSFYFSNKDNVLKNFDCVKKLYFSLLAQFEKNKKIIDAINELLPNVEIRTSYHK